ncbi:tRNA threonylcarbamoyladenosine biosynthesis protein TsaE [hydrothermal vent metagenome]|uniref:tRNA threonylcarbamoyladenosine biosynthesis protein TsaE n=1 Tax=hydrothermal vent metagenome TaxID=652676 RepID=A0A3B0SZG5_9ZZZZ
MKTKYTEDLIQEVAKQLLQKTNSKTLCFYGEMGSGKTTLIKALVKELGCDTASSPTFGIVHEYHYKQGGVLGYHFDFYRLNDESEALDLGLEDYFAQDIWIFIEWPEKIESFLPVNTTDIHIEIVDPITRKISF